MTILVVEEVRKNILVGRDKDLNEILKDLKSNKGTRLLIVGESGSGKSALLDELYRILTEEVDQNNRPFVGYYSKKESLIAESESLIYPFSIVLEKLLNNAKESEQLYEKLDSTLSRVKQGFIKFGKEQGIKLGVAIIDDLANKVGLKETLDVGKGFLEAVSSEKTSLMLAQRYIADHRDEARQSYLETLQAVANEFKERRFVLIFDQFESVGKASTDLFLNFVKFLKPQERFEIIVSFRTDDTTWNDASVRSVYEDLERKLAYDLDAKKISIEGLSAEDMGKWIKQVRGIFVPLIPDLQRIRNYSAGLPLLLDEWIRSSQDLRDYDNIRRDKLCTQLVGVEGLEDKLDEVRLDKMCILLYPLKLEGLAAYLGMGDNNVDLIAAFVKRLSNNRIFDKDLEWFRHELVKKCFEDRLGNEENRRCHEGAAKFFESLVEEKYTNENTIIKDGEAGEKYPIVMSYAYHLHNAGGKYHEKSFKYNKALAEHASRSGDLDVAERCYKRAIADANECYKRATEYPNKIRYESDEKGCAFKLVTNVYYMWGRYEEALINFY